ncbi:MAG: GlxA family transcriptional regulator [Phycicoccus sp.]
MALRVAVLAYPGCFGSEVFGVPDLLTMARTVAGRQTEDHDLAICSPRRRVTAAGGLPLRVDPVREVDVLIVPGFDLDPARDIDAMMAPLAPEIDLIRRHTEAGRVVVSICVGALLLGDAGTLDGRRATTAWFLADDFARRYPRTDLHADQLVVTDAGVTTTAAFSAMYDFALDLVRRTDGDPVARRLARVGLLDQVRTSQTPYVDHAMLPQVGHRFSARVMRHLDQRVGEPVPLSAVAAVHHVSVRTLLRRFRSETGQTPLGYLQAARMRRARTLLETTEQSVAQIARTVGYADPSTFARLFATHAGQGPRDYRATFSRRL